MFSTRRWITARWLGLTAASVLAVVSVAAAALPSGFRGHVTIGPLQPVCRAGTPCDGPAKRVTLTFSRTAYVRSVVTDAAGDYRIVLRPGAYTVSASRGMSIKPHRVWVHRGLVAKLNFAIDTGIR